MGSVMNKKMMIRIVKDHALNNWKKDNGWDIIYEAFTDDELWEQVSHCSTAASAIQIIDELCKTMDSFRKERRAIVDMVNDW
jgi:hypothetical protein